MRADGPRSLNAAQPTSRLHVQQDPVGFYNVLAAHGATAAQRRFQSDDRSGHSRLWAGPTPPGGANSLDGVLIECSSQHAVRQADVIPLGMSSLQRRNGLELAGTASGTVVFNTFAAAAFKTYGVPNVLWTPSSRRRAATTVVRTTVISGKRRPNGSTSPRRHGVQIAQDIMRQETNGGDADSEMACTGVLSDRQLHDNLIGGEKFPSLPNPISATERRRRPSSATPSIIRSSQLHRHPIQRAERRARRGRNSSAATPGHDSSGNRRPLRKKSSGTTRRRLS